MDSSLISWIHLLHQLSKRNDALILNIASINYLRLRIFIDWRLVIKRVSLCDDFKVFSLIRMFKHCFWSQQAFIDILRDSLYITLLSEHHGSWFSLFGTWAQECILLNLALIRAFCSWAKNPMNLRLVEVKTILFFHDIHALCTTHAWEVIWNRLPLHMLVEALRHIRLFDEPLKHTYVFLIALLCLPPLLFVSFVLR